MPIVTATNVSNHEILQLVEKRLISYKVPPVSCSMALMQVRTGETTDPNEGKLYARYTNEPIHFWISVHNEKYDATRWSMFEQFGFYYERILSNIFQQVLSGKEGHVLDVGGNIGWFALLSASLGAQVATFEPHRVNYLRMCESMCLNGWLHGSDTDCMSGSKDPFVQERIHIFPYAASEHEGQLQFHENSWNPGMGQVNEDRSENSTVIKAVTLDGMVGALGWSNVDIDILKVDVEGAEVEVFLGAKQLLASKRVQNIFMEGNLRSQREKDDLKRIAMLLVESGYVLHMIGGYSGPETTNVPPVDEKFYSSLLGSCGDVHSKIKREQCNIWWKGSHAQ
jgi:FkbM family methyltransferase